MEKDSRAACFAVQSRADDDDDDDERFYRMVLRRVAYRPCLLIGRLEVYAGRAYRLEHHRKLEVCPPIPFWSVPLSATCRRDLNVFMTGRNDDDTHSFV